MSPSQRGFWATLLAAVVGVAGVACAGALASLLEEPGVFVEGFGLFSGMVAVPVSLVLFWLAAALTPGHFARMWSFVGATLFALVGATLLGVGFGFGSTWPKGVLVGMLFYGLPVALSGMGLLYNAGIGIPAARQAEHVARLDRLAALVSERGQVGLAELALALEVTPERAVELAAEVRRTGRAALEVDLHHERVWGQAWANLQTGVLRRQLETAGRLEVRAFAKLRDVPEEMVREWVYTLVYRRELTGYVSWKEGVLYAADAAALRGSSRCPACGGQLELVARGVVECQHCDAQTFTAGF